MTPSLVLSGVEGMIGYWPDAVGTIPTGWGLCDGSQGTPNLVDRFSLGSGDIYPVDDTGGITSHRHFLTTDGHDHTVVGPLLFDEGLSYDKDLSIEQMTADSSLNSHLSPYYGLLPIMRLS